MNIKKLKNMYDNLVITNGEEYWKMIVMEYLINNFEEKNSNISNITEEKIDNMASNIMTNDNLWEEIDFATANAIKEEMED